MHFRNSSLATLLFVCLLLNSCSKDDKGDDGPADLNLSGNGLIVLNEGGFQRGNASMGFVPEEAFGPEALEGANAQHGLFQERNGFLLGDIGHSMKQIGEYLYVVVNNSGIIRVLEPESFQQVAQIEGFTSPRYIEPITETKAYVSDLYSNKISIVDLNKREITGSIPLRGMSEKMLVYRKEVYVANNKNPHVFVIDIETDSITDSINIGGFCNELHLYKAQVAAVRNTKTVEDNTGAIVVINTLSHSLSTITEFEYDDKMWYNRSFAVDNSIYLLAGASVFHFESGLMTKLFETTQVTGNGIYVWQDAIWISNAKDYQQKGALEQYSMDGELLSTSATGIIPGQVMYFEKSN